MEGKSLEKTYVGLILKRLNNTDERFEVVIEKIDSIFDSIHTPNPSLNAIGFDLYRIKNEVAAIKREVHIAKEYSKNQNTL